MNNVNVNLYDGLATFEVLQTIAWVALVGAALFLLGKLGSLPKPHKQTLILIFAVWAITSVGVAGLKSYTYVSDQREIYQSLQDIPESQSGGY